MSRHDRPTKTARALRLGRIAISTLLFVGVTLFLVSGSARLMMATGWIAKIQLVPVALSVSVAALLFWVLATIIFGRVYCSTVCPMGYLQDIVARLSRLRRDADGRWRRREYHFARPQNTLRLNWLIIIVATALLGVLLLLSLFDPYAAFSRVASYLVRPAVEFFGGEAIVGGTLIGIAVAAATLIAIAVISARGGRAFCNTLCPVGSALGLFSSNSLFGFDINTDRCVQCRRCEHACKSRCINMSDHTVDMSRCVVCFDCVDACRDDAISYTFRRHTLSTPLMMRIGFPRAATRLTPSAGDADNASKSQRPVSQAADDGKHSARHPIDRRRFLMTGLILAAAPAVIAVDRAANRLGGEPRRQNPTTPHRPVAPPGVSSTNAFLQKCVGCGACVAACPAHVLRPSSRDYGWQRALHPVMDFDAAYCDYDCVICTEICPTSALNPLTVDEKHSTAIGLAIVDESKCVGCGLCVSSCPKQTISMRAVGAGHRVAVVDQTLCIGCGKCQYVCPATPDKAIVVNGLQR